MKSLSHRIPLACAISVLVIAVLADACGGGAGPPAPIHLTLEDFHLPGTQANAFPNGVIPTSDDRAICHGGYDAANEPYELWRGSLMANAGRDPLFEAHLTNACQDVPAVGYFCMRCHVRLWFPTVP